MLQLAELGIEVKIATGDNARVAEKVCADLGLVSKGTITGAEMEHFGDEEFEHAAQNYSIFARISPEQKARLITAARRTGRSVGFLGDGVNDALALHAADVGISVDTATDVAKDAADVILLEKDLGVLATGVATGRRIFANTIKYVFMGTSSNFGNTFSAAAASAFLPFLPMLASQILLGNLLYDASQLAIPTDRVDEEQTDAPSHWNVAFIRRFMLTFGPINSLFDFLTFGFMLGILHAGEVAFHTGWFLENLAHPNVYRFRDPHPQSAVPAQSAGHAADRHADVGGRDRHCAHRDAAGPQTGFRPAAVAVLRRAGRVHRPLPGPRRSDQESVLQRADARFRPAVSHPRPEPPDCATRRALRSFRRERRRASALFGRVSARQKARDIDAG